MTITYETVVDAAFAIVLLNDEQKKDLLLKLLKSDPEPVIAALRNNEKITTPKLDDKYSVVVVDNDEYSNYRNYLIKNYREFHKVTLAKAKEWWEGLRFSNYMFAMNLNLEQAQMLRSVINQNGNLIVDIEQQIKES